MKNLLNQVNSPEDLKQLSVDQLPLLCEEIRKHIIESLSEQGGHVGANLGVVELTTAMHYVFNSPVDKIVWDVSHQCYTHKVLTGRKDLLKTIRLENGLLGFTNPAESVHDHFTVGHASTAFSQALGLAIARDLLKKNENIIALCGDGALTGGLCFEALNNIGHQKKNMLLILNDNELSIDKNVGSVSRYLNRMLTNPIYDRLRTEVEEQLRKVPPVGKLVRKLEESVKNVLVPGIVFEELGIRYFGPVDGHDLPGMIKVLTRLKSFTGPCILHVITKKAKGIDFLKDEPPASYHSSGPYCIESYDDKKGYSLATKSSGGKKKSFTQAFGESIVELAEEDEKIVAITAAMPAGTGLTAFQKKFPDRYYDVGIAEGHAITSAGGMSVGGLKPICAIYSTFLQRAFDHLIHDCALQKANVTVCMDRSGLCGPDGPSHHGMFDFSYLRAVPGSVVSSPRNKAELKQLMRLSLNYQGVFGIRYPKEDIVFESDGPVHFEIGEGEVVLEGEDLLIVTLGHMVDHALEVSENLKKQGIRAAVYNLRFIKPLDIALLDQAASKYKFWVTMEEHVVTGGLGSVIAEYLALNQSSRNISLRPYAFPEEFIPHGSRSFLFEKYGMSVSQISASLLQEWKACKL